MKYKAWQQDTIERLAAVDPNWEYWNVLRLEVVKKEYGFPILAKAHHGPFINKGAHRPKGLHLAYNYVGYVEGQYCFYVHQDDYWKLRTGITEHGIVIEHTNTVSAADCPWWMRVKFRIRSVPSDRFITADGRVIYYDDLAEQLLLDL